MRACKRAWLKTYLALLLFGLSGISQNDSKMENYISDITQAAYVVVELIVVLNKHQQLKTGYSDNDCKKLADTVDATAVNPVPGRPQLPSQFIFFDAKLKEILFHFEEVSRVSSHDYFMGVIQAYNEAAGLSRASDFKLANSIAQPQLKEVERLFWSDRAEIKNYVHNLSGVMFTPPVAVVPKSIVPPVRPVSVPPVPPVSVPPVNRNVDSKFLCFGACATTYYFPREKIVKDNEVSVWYSEYVAAKDVFTAKINAFSMFESRCKASGPRHSGIAEVIKKYDPNSGTYFLVGMNRATFDCR